MMTLDVLVGLEVVLVGFEVVLSDLMLNPKLGTRCRNKDINNECDGDGVESERCQCGQVSMSQWLLYRHIWSSEVFVDFDQEDVLYLSGDRGI